MPQDTNVVPLGNVVVRQPRDWSKSEMATYSNRIQVSERHAALFKHSRDLYDEDAAWAYRFEGLQARFRNWLFNR